MEREGGRERGKMREWEREREEREREERERGGEGREREREKEEEREGSAMNTLQIDSTEEPDRER